MSYFNNRLVVCAFLGAGLLILPAQSNAFQPNDAGLATPDNFDQMPIQYHNGSQASPYDAPQGYDMPQRDLPAAPEIPRQPAQFPTAPNLNAPQDIQQGYDAPPQYNSYPQNQNPYPDVQRDPNSDYMDKQPPPNMQQGYDSLPQSNSYPQTQNPYPDVQRDPESLNDSDPFDQNQYDQNPQDYPSEFIDSGEPDANLPQADRLPLQTPFEPPQIDDFSPEQELQNPQPYPEFDQQQLDDIRQ